MEKIDSALEYVSEHASGCRAIGNEGKPNSSDLVQQERHDLSASAGPRQAFADLPSSDDVFKPEDSTFSAPASVFRGQARPADMLRDAILNHVQYTLVRPITELKPIDYLKPVSLAIRDRIVDCMLETESRFRHIDAKRLYYLSMEFLMGRSLGDNVSNLRIEELCRGVLAGLGVSLDEVLDSESDAGLGNGGLGRLAACFLESLATLNMPGLWLRDRLRVRPVQAGNCWRFSAREA